MKRLKRRRFAFLTARLIETSATHLGVPEPALGSTRIGGRVPASM
jgi:hypothetical protein